MKSDAVQCTEIKYNTMTCNTIQNHEMTFNTLQWNWVQCNTIQYHMIPWSIKQYYAINSNTIQYHAMPWYASPPCPLAISHSQFLLKDREKTLMILDPGHTVPMIMVNLYIILIVYRNHAYDDWMPIRILILQEVCSQIWATLYDYPSLKVTFPLSSSSSLSLSSSS